MQDWEYAFRIAALRLKGAFLSEPYYYSRTHAQESIGDILYQPEGVSVDLRSLDAIEDTITASDDPSRELIYTVFRLYLKLLRRAACYGTHSEVEACFRGLERNSVEWPRKMRVGILHFVYQTLGARAMRFVTELYSQVQTGR
jgi:hypothetical protein